MIRFRNVQYLQQDRSAVRLVLREISSDSCLLSIASDIYEQNTCASQVMTFLQSLVRWRVSHPLERGSSDSG